MTEESEATTTTTTTTTTAAVNNEKVEENEKEKPPKCCRHCIELKNLKENEIVTNTILFIRGEITEFKTNSNCGNEVTLRRISNTNASDDKEYKSLIDHNGMFKLLINLNDIIKPSEESEPQSQSTPDITISFKFSYCNVTEHVVKVNYKELNKTYSLQPVYLVCQDEQPSDADVTENLEKINLNLKLVQSLYADRLVSAGFEHRTFALNDCINFKSKITLEEAFAKDEYQLWEYFAEELILDHLQNHKDLKVKFVGFIACTKYEGEKLASSDNVSYENIKKHLHGHAALGGGGLALFGTAHFYCWPRNFDDIIKCITDETKVDVTQFPDASNYRGTYGANYASSLGAVCHEIAHTFHLGHDAGIMGNGVDFLNRLLTINNLTENLPNRTFDVQRYVASAESNEGGEQNPKFTRIKRTNENKFLETYHRQRQKDYDEFHFTKNCALILFHNKWLSNTKEETVKEDEEKPEISFNLETGVITYNPPHTLSIIELRNCVTSCVDDFIVVVDKEKEEDANANSSGEAKEGKSETEAETETASKSESTCTYTLPEAFWKAKSDSNYLFVGTSNGVHAKFELKST